MEFSSGDIITHKNYPKNRFFYVVGTSGDICYCVNYPYNDDMSNKNPLFNFSKDLVDLVTCFPTLEILKLFRDYV